MYEFVTGPLAWLAFAVFFLGLAYRLIWYIRGLDWQLDRVSYGHNTSFGVKGALRSVGYWLLPYGTHSWRKYPGFTLLFFVFHIGLVLTPIFLLGHNLLLQERWGISWPTLPEPVADFLTVAMMVAAVLILLRRAGLPEVRILTKPYDVILLVIAVAPFFTGFMAYHQVGHYRSWLIAHIICGEIMLVAIPLTKLSHFLLFFLSRIQLGLDFGIKRGGMKSKGMPW